MERVPADAPGHDAVTVAIDDTLFRRRGNKVRADSAYARAAGNFTPVHEAA